MSDDRERMEVNVGDPVWIIDEFGDMSSGVARVITQLYYKCEIEDFEGLETYWTYEMNGVFHRDDTSHAIEFLTDIYHQEEQRWHERQGDIKRYIDKLKQHRITEESNERQNEQEQG